MQAEHYLQRNGMNRSLEETKDINHGVNMGRFLGGVTLAVHFWWNLIFEAGDTSGKMDKTGL